MRRSVIISCLMLLVLTGTGWAGDIVATWKYSNGATMTLSARDDDHIRMDTAKDSYTLLTGGKTYMVTRGDDGWQATDMEKMAGMMGGVFGGQKKVDVDDYKTTYKYTGKKETVAGYTGKIYQVEVRDGAGKLVSSDELVLSTSKDIFRINMAMARIGSKMSGMAASGMSAKPEAVKKQADQYGSVLRYGKDMTLVSIKKPSLKASHYELPSGTTQREVKAPSTAPQDTTGAANEQTAGKKSGFFGSLLKSSEDAAKEQTETNTTNEVKEGVNKIFNNFFKKE